MSPIVPVIVLGDMVTTFGWGINASWNALLNGHSGIKSANRFNMDSFISANGALIEGIAPRHDQSLVMQMLHPLFERSKENIPQESDLILATTTGEIDLLEQYIDQKQTDQNASCPHQLAIKIKTMCHLDGETMVISAACASSTQAVAVAAAMIKSGEKNSVLVTGCDAVSEFVYSGFSSIRALDPETARPFDQNRKGLTLGEAAGYILLMSETRAKKEKRKILGKVCGWGLTNDANHMTGPSRDGEGLSRAIYKALEMAKTSTDRIGNISAHGTGTIYNDSMEMKAFKHVFQNTTVPTYSIKGGTGHTLGATGLVEILIALKSIEEKKTPPSVNLNDIDTEALGWVHKTSVAFNQNHVLTTNSGFGGINCAMVVSK